MYKWSAVVIPVTAFVSILLFFAYLQFFPVNWGSLTYEPARQVTVYGISREQQTNQVASFSVGVNETDPDKQTAVDQVNTTINDIVAKLKEFGIPDKDIQTQNMSIYFMEDEFREPRLEPQWNASSNVEVVLRDVSRANDLATLLTNTGATNVYGPNFRLDAMDNPEDALLESAIDDAREKAGNIAAASGARLGKVISIDETMSGGMAVPMMAMRDGLGGGAEAALEPGSTTVSKTVKVVFELR